MGFDGSEIDRLLKAAVEAGRLHGIVAMVVDRDGVLYEGAAGDAGPDTIFRNASMTKAVATTGALQLVEQDRLSLDQTVESVSGVRRAAGDRGVRRRPADPSPAGLAADDPPADDAYGRAGLLLPQRAAVPLRPGDGLPNPLEARRSR